VKTPGPFLSGRVHDHTEQLSALSSILAQSGLHSLFQPIICLSERRILGEALSRGPSNSPLHSPCTCSPSPARPGA
jgi:EAL domain-containing protein (putative c-di-GMP-specific phosphodiesterase class I)